jgi:outer membrane protein TolC
MKPSIKKHVGVLIRPCLLLFFAVQAGCAGLSRGEQKSYVAPVPQAAQAARVSPEIQTASYQEAPSSAASKGTAPLAPDPHTPAFAGLSELSVEALLQDVLARNPSLAQMVAAWEAAQARYPQVTSLDDPMFGTYLAPAAIGQIEDKNRGYRLDISQKLPWCGKLALKGENAKAQAQAAANDVDDMRLQLIASAKTAFYDYYLVYRALEVNAENLKLLREFRQNAESRYKTGLAPEQDVLQADVEIGRQEKRNFILERVRQVAIGRINTLLNLPPESPLPPPPKKIVVEDGLPDAVALRESALARRPDLRALANRIAAEEASLGLAYKDYYPDFNVMAAYDPFWSEKQQRPQIGVQMNIPLQLARRDAAVSEAKARILERRAELARQVNQVNYEFNQAYAEVNESRQTVRLYEKKVVPAADLNVKSAQSAYLTGKIPFLTLLQAERDVISLKDEYYEYVADYYRRLAMLERVAGGSLLPGPDAVPPGQHPALLGAPCDVPPVR